MNKSWKWECRQSNNSHVLVPVDFRTMFVLGAESQYTISSPLVLPENVCNKMFLVISSFTRTYK